MRKLEPLVQNYEWGMPSSQSIASSFVEKNMEKVAELWWMAPSFLLKLLFVGGPLSLQVHPSKEQLSSHLFPDPYPKPEIVLALTEFEALCGFLDEGHVWQNISNIPALHPYPQFSLLFKTDPIDHGSILLSVKDYAITHPDHAPCDLFLSLLQRYPMDVASLAPFYMNHVRLTKGEALIIPASQPHCYLSGQGVECMPPSDNIVRCGLTKKECHVDLFFELCVPQEVIIKKDHYHHEALGEYFSIHVPHDLFVCPPHSMILVLEGNKCGVWVAEEEEEVRFYRDAIVVVPPNTNKKT